MPEQIQVRGARVQAPGAEDLAFNSQGACPTCDGTGIVRTVDESTLVPDESLPIDQGAVAPWQTLMWSLMMDFTYFNAIYTVENALSKVKDAKGMKRVEKFLKQGVCPDCGGTRLSAAARAPRLRGCSPDEVCKMPLTELAAWVDGVPGSLPAEMRPMAESICQSFRTVAKRLMDLGLGYLSLDRAASTLSTGERQRMQLARAVRNRTTGVLYVLDEPTIGLHPLDVRTLLGVFQALIGHGATVIVIELDLDVIRSADYIIDMGPGGGEAGGRVVAVGTPEEIAGNPNSMTGHYLERR